MFNINTPYQIEHQRKCQQEKKQEIFFFGETKSDIKENQLQTNGKV